VSVNETLALANACVTAVAVVCMTAGFVAIRRKNIARHRRLMIAATTASALFMVGFVVRFARFGFRPFSGGAGWRNVYQLVFFTHEPLAVINVPLVLGALTLGLRRRFKTHREVARVALVVWLYVCLSGIAVFALLHFSPGR
jgi:putative membrane protein